jgi:hypothetical protein
MMKVPNHLYVLIFVPLLLPQSAPTQVITQRVLWLTFREYSKCVTLYTIYISVAVNGPGMTSRYGVARKKRWARSQGHKEISPAKTYKCQKLQCWGEMEKNISILLYIRNRRHRIIYSRLSTYLRTQGDKI